MSGIIVFNSLHDIPLDHQFVLLSAWREAREASIVLNPLHFPIAAALETSGGRILTGNKHERPYHPSVSPGLSHEALATISQALDTSQEKILCVVFIGPVDGIVLSGPCIDMLWEICWSNLDIPMYLSDINLGSIGLTSPKNYIPPKLQELMHRKES